MAEPSQMLPSRASRFEVIVHDLEKVARILDDWTSVTFLREDFFLLIFKYLINFSSFSLNEQKLYDPRQTLAQIPRAYEAVPRRQDRL